MNNGDIFKKNLFFADLAPMNTVILILGDLGACGDGDAGGWVEENPFGRQLLIGLVGAAPAGDGADPENEHQRHTVEIIG